MNRFVALVAFALLAILTVVASVDSATTGKIEGRLQFPDATPFNISTRISLNHGEHLTYSAQDGSFTFYHVSPGIHVLDIQSPTYHFSQVKIQLLEESMDTPKCLEYLYPGAKKQPIQHPVTLSALATYDYFEAKRGFTVLGILGNPMIIMMIVSVGIMFALPKLIEGMDPEEKEQMRKQMEMQQDPSKMFNNLWGEISGTKAVEEEKAKARRLKRQADDAK